jgi:hypothetical protein
MPGENEQILRRYFQEVLSGGNTDAAHIEKSIGESQQSIGEPL